MITRRPSFITVENVVGLAFRGDWSGDNKAAALLDYSEGSRDFIFPFHKQNLRIPIMRLIRQPVKCWKDLSCLTVLT